MRGRFTHEHDEHRKVVQVVIDEGDGVESLVDAFLVGFKGNRARVQFASGAHRTVRKSALRTMDGERRES